MKRLLLVALVLSSTPAFAFALRATSASRFFQVGPEGALVLRDADGISGFAIRAGLTQWLPGPLPVCNLSQEFAVKADVTTGTGTGKRSKLCLCTSDGAVMPTYAWQNLATGTVGTTTTCITE